jgi:hypothetical protein
MTGDRRRCRWRPSEVDDESVSVELHDLAEEIRADVMQRARKRGGIGVYRTSDESSAVCCRIL